MFLSILFSSSRINVKDHSLDISFEEWRDYLLFHPSADLADIIASWRHNTVRPRELWDYTYGRDVMLSIYFMF